MRLGTQQVNRLGHLEVGGCDTVALAETYGTPLYVLDETAFRERCRAYRSALRQLKPNIEVVYAGKASLNMAICQIVHQEGLGLDVASGGELYTALQAGFPAERIHFHGVFKTESELRMAYEAGVGAVVLDNFEEIARLSEIASRVKPQPVKIRIAPEVEASTHPLIRTGQRDSKFGFHLLNGDAYRAVERVLGKPNLHLRGFHCHIGSQIRDLSAFEEAVRAMVTFADEVRQRTGYVAEVLNVGGGLAVRYTPDDTVPDLNTYAQTLVNTLRTECERLNYPEPTLGIEPGRSLIAEAGLTLYRVGAVKQVPHDKPDLPSEYLIIDGGVSDNPRPQMYGARYTAVHGNRADEPHDRPYRILGKHCETDPVIECALLPETRAGDLIAVLTTGAYAYSMSSQYNRYPRPAMVAVCEGKAHVIVERETYEDVLRHDRLRAD